MKLYNYIDFIFFIFFIFLIFIFSLIIFFSRDLILSVFCLILTFILSSCCLIIINIKFIALIYIGTYVGAVFILFLFITIIIDTRAENWLSESNFVNSIFFFFIIIINFFIITNYIIDFIQFIPILIFNLNLFNLTCKTEFFYSLLFSNDINILSFFLYTQYYYYFIFISLLLLLGMVGSLSLISNNNNTIFKKF